jgi:hypothetical protein
MAASNLARAQQVVLVVNSDVITNYDIEQRMKFVQLSTASRRCAAKSSKTSSTRS